MEPIRLPLRKRLTVQLSAAFVLLFILFGTALGYSLYLSQQRETDIAVVNTAERLRLLAMGMQRQATNYLRVPARNYASFYRDVQLYYQDLSNHTRSFDEELSCFTSGSFQMRGPQAAATRTYHLNAAGDASVQDALAAWRSFQGGLDAALGSNRAEPRLEYAAAFVQGNAQRLVDTANALHARFEGAALAHLEAGRRANRVVVAGALVVLAGIMWWAIRALRPLRAAVTGFQRVAQGDLGHRVQVDVDNELSALAVAFNSMTDRLCAVLRLLDRLQQAGSIGPALQVVHDELRLLLPVEWVGWLRSKDGALQLQEFAPTASDCLGARCYRGVPAAVLQATTDGEPLRIPDLHWAQEPEMGFLHALRERGFNGVMLAPIASGNGGPVLALAAKRPHAYLLEQQELLSNLTPFLAHALARFSGEERVADERVSPGVVQKGLV